MPGFPLLGYSLLLLSALIFYIGGWAGKTRLLSLEHMEGKRIFFSSKVLCVCSNASARAEGARSWAPVPFSMNVRALHAVAELLQPCSQKSSSCLHRAVPTMAAAGSCLRQQQPATAMVKSVMILHIPGCCALGKGSYYLTCTQEACQDGNTLVTVASGRITYCKYVFI